MKVTRILKSGEVDVRFIDTDMLMRLLKVAELGSRNIDTADMRVLRCWITDFKNKVKSLDTK